MTECVYILLPVHNRREITRRIIECLKSQTYQNYHLVLIDDGSTDGTEEMVRSYISAITVIRGNGNWWWGGSLQQGYLWLKSKVIQSSDVVLIINDDTEFESDFLEKGVTLLRGFRNSLLLAQCYDRDTRKLIDAGVHVDWRRLRFEQASTPEQINCLSTRGVFLRVGDFYNIGGFYPRLLPHYASDYEFTIRACRKGLKLLTVPSLSLFVDQNTTGIHKMGNERFFTTLKKLFSQKSIPNPLMWTAFILLVCPWQYKAVNLLRVWFNAVLLLFSSLSNGKFIHKKESD